MLWRSPVILLMILVLSVISPQLSVIAEDPAQDEVDGFEVVIEDRVSHEDDAFTQGLLWHQGMLYESTGLYGESTLREVHPNGTLNRTRSLDGSLFGEGLALVDDSLIQLTYRKGEALIWNLTTFNRTGSFTYEGEGWGLCNLGGQLVMSNGSSSLALRNNTDFSIESHLEVSLDGQPVENLNELECHDGRVWANIWQDDRIIRINMSTGEVDMVVDASLLTAENSGSDEDVLNGIAIDDQGRMWLTGKRWNTLYRISLVEVIDEVEEKVEDDDNIIPQPRLGDDDECVDDDACLEEAPFESYLILSIILLSAVITIAVGMFKVWRGPDRMKKAYLGPLRGEPVEEE